MANAETRKTFINSIGTWEIQEDGTIRLISEERHPRRVKERRKWRKNAGKEKRV
tara:strand:- start:48 stop:209 length:162 start_codon:yes stop_codon:yes gene_type:complete